MKHFYLILLFPLLANSQDFGGKYISEENLTTTTIIFQDSTFKKGSGVMLSHGADLSQGKYLMVNDTIVLKYIPYDKTHSHYEILDQKDSIYPKFGSRKKVDEKTLNLNVEISDFENNPLSDPIIVIKSDDEVLGSITSTGTNHFSYLSTDKTVKEITIMKLGYEPVTLDLKNFRGYHTDIKTVLNLEDPNTYSEEKKIEKYIWNKNNNTIKLVTPKPNREVVYKGSTEKD